MPGTSELPNSTRRSVSLWKVLTTHDWPLARETTLFLLANALDYLMTFWLLHLGGGDRHGGYRENNPIAAYFLNHWGPFKGLLIFKAGLVLLVCVITQIIALQKPRTASWLLTGATVVASFVVLYSLRLLLRMEGIL